MKSEKFLLEKFRDYYRGEKPDMPKKFSRREFGFMFFGSRAMARHIAFSTTGNLKSFLVGNAPAHVFYSSAYYSKPAEKRMEDKDWLGADLIFDLDADHLAGADRMDYRETLDKVRREALKLVDDFLIRDFGFENFEIVFSGSRGYHIHVYDEQVLNFGSRERREIVDYLTGKGIDLEVIMKRNGVYVLPSEQEAGWYGRIGRAIRGYAGELMMGGRERAVNELKSIRGVGDKKASEIYDKLGKMNFDRVMNALPDEFVEHLMSDVAVIGSKGETDEPVTSDIKRLIRMPGSLHGKTGFIVKRIDLEELTTFDPLSDALFFGEEPLEVEFLRPLRLRIGDITLDVKEERISIPEYAAVFACARGFATPV